jgi:CRISPR type III-A-associated RAMP protein Csm4
MAEYNVLKMNFLSPLHLGQGVTESYGRSGRILHSDSLSGALASVYSVQYPEEDVKLFMENYKISSAYPFIRESFFFPKPMVKLPFCTTEESLNLTKRIKSLEYFDQNSFETILAGNELILDMKHIAGNGKYYLASVSENFISPFSSEVVQRVSVPRGEGGDASPFHFERLSFNKDCGFWFFYEVTSEYRQQFFETMILLGENGIGTDRTVGNGQFTVSLKTIDVKLPSENQNRLLVSLFCPSEKDTQSYQAANSSYLLIKRGGFIAGSSDARHRHLRKKSIHMFLEGSVFNGNVEGKIENLRPEWKDVKLHPVWRDGRAFSLPITV